MNQIAANPRTQKQNIFTLVLAPVIFLLFYLTFSWIIRDEQHTGLVMAFFLFVPFVAIAEFVRPSRVDYEASPYVGFSRYFMAVVHGFAWSAWSLGAVSVLLLARW